MTKKLFGRKGRYWLFPSAPKPKVPMAESVRAALPLYLTYPEFLQQVESSLVACALPDKSDALQVCHQIKVEKCDFLAQDWMRRVSKTWSETLSPDFAFRSMTGLAKYWWCRVQYVEKDRDVWTYLILSVDAEGRLLRYAFYSPGGNNDDSCHYLIRTQKTRFEKEENYSSARTFIANVRKISRRGEHFICSAKTKNEYLQAIKNRDGTFCVEYQMYYMPWQMMNDDCNMKDVLRILRLFLKGGIPSISNAIAWELCEHNKRAPFDLGIYLKKKLEKAEKSGCREIVETINAVGVTSKTPIGQVVCPVFLNKRGRPVHWGSTLFYLPKNSSPLMKAMIRVCASLEKDPWPYDLHELGSLFSNGSGVRRNYNLALFWEKKALRYGSIAAKHEICRLKSVLDPERERKSARRRERLQSKIAEVLRSLSSGMGNREVAYDLVYDILLDAEYDLHDGKMTKKDANAVLRQCACALMGIDNGSIAASPPTASSPTRPNPKSSHTSSSCTRR